MQIVLPGLALISQTLISLREWQMVVIHYRLKDILKYLATRCRKKYRWGCISKCQIIGTIPGDYEISGYADDYNFFQSFTAVQSSLAGNTAAIFLRLQIILLDAVFGFFCKLGNQCKLYYSADDW